MTGRLLTAEEKTKMEKLSIGIMDLCDASGLDDGLLIVNAALIGCAAAVASTIPEHASIAEVEDIAAKAATVLAQQIIEGQARFLSDMEDATTATRN